jgi:hypothetical protein
MHDDLVGRELNLIFVAIFIHSNNHKSFAYDTKIIKTKLMKLQGCPIKNPLTRLP